MGHLAQLNIFELPVDEIINDARSKIDSGAITIPKVSETKPSTSRRSVTYANDVDLSIKSSPANSPRLEISRLRSHDLARTRSREAAVRPSRSRSSQEGREDSYDSNARRPSVGSQIGTNSSQDLDFADSHINFESGLLYILSQNGGSLLGDSDGQREEESHGRFTELRRRCEDAAAWIHDEFRDVSDFPGIVQLVHRDCDGERATAQTLEDVFPSIEEISSSSPGTASTFADDKASRVAYLLRKIEVLRAIEEDETRINAVLKLRLEEALRRKTQADLKGGSQTGGSKCDPVSARRGREALEYFRKQQVCFSA